MQSYSWWIVIAFVVLVLELVTGTFYLLVISVAAAVAAAAAYFGATAANQLLVAAIVGTLGVIGLRRSRYGKPQQKLDSQRDPNVNLDIGQVVQVPQWNPDRSARIIYRGAAWDVELATGQSAAPGQFRITEIRGSRLIVETVE